MRYVLFILLITTGKSFAQVNYVQNADFEKYDTCPSDWDQIRFATFWSGIDSITRANPLGDPPEYSNLCAPSNSFIATPSAVYWYQYPHSLSGMAILTAFDDELDTNAINSYFYRSYIQGRLYKKLAAGKQYCVSFYVNFAEGSKYAIKELGAYLDNGIIDTTANPSLPQTMYNPQVVNSGGILQDTMNWVKIQGSFIANGREQFITLGNFKDKAHTTYNTQPINDYNQPTVNGFYLIDDVSVVESDLKADAGTDKHIGLGDSVYIGRPMSSAVWCDWTVLGSSTILGKGPSIWVKPTTTTSYVVTQTLCGQTKKDTVKVEVWKLGVTSINGNTQHYSLSPNPATSSIQLYQEQEDLRPVVINVYDAVGRMVRNTEVALSNGKTEMSVVDLVPGIYYLHVRDTYGTAYNLKFVKN